MEAPGTVEKAIEVLYHLHGESAPRGVTAIGRALEMPKSSVHRLLAALARGGLVERDEGGRYRPGVGLVALGLGVLDREPTVVAARPVLEQLAEELDETCFLVGARARALVVLEKAEGTGFLRAAPRVGSSVPVHATAVGKLYLAFAPDSLSAEATRCLEPHTAHTLADRDALTREIEAVRSHGLAWNRDEWIDGLSVLAAPVWLGDRLVGAVALALPSAALGRHRAVDLEARVREASVRIGDRLSGHRTGSRTGDPA